MALKGKIYKSHGDISKVGKQGNLPSCGLYIYYGGNYLSVMCLLMSLHVFKFTGRK